MKIVREIETWSLSPMKHYIVSSESSGGSTFWILLKLYELCVSCRINPLETVFFFFFFLILVFLVVRGIKWQKMAQNDKIFCLSHSVSQELYIIWFLVDWCKMMISPAIFSHFFKILIFWCFGGEGKRAKNDTYYQFQSVTIYISGTVNHMKIVGTQVQGV